MKQFLVPALLLALVGAAAAMAAGSAPAVATSEPAAECHAFTALSGVCPFSGGSHCDAEKGAVECTPEMAAKCPMGDMSEECKKRCEEKQTPDCCKKSIDCEKCEKHETPVEKP
jgi:hypothetical protein